MLILICALDIYRYIMQHLRASGQTTQMDNMLCGGVFLIEVEVYHVRHTNVFISMWPSDNIWRQKSGSTLAQVMACCLTAPSHYLNQC